MPVLSSSSDWSRMLSWYSRACLVTSLQSFSRQVWMRSTVCSRAGPALLFRVLLWSSAKSSRLLGWPGELAMSLTSFSSFTYP